MMPSAVAAVVVVAVAARFCSCLFVVLFSALFCYRCVLGPPSGRRWLGCVASLFLSNKSKCDTAVTCPASNKVQKMDSGGGSRVVDDGWRQWAGRGQLRRVLADGGLPSPLLG
jgi:hypothetical protein